MVVGLGASAGGLEALQDFFAALTDVADAAFVVVQHLDPSTKSMLPELLGRVTTMPVADATDRMPLAPGHVYVAPPHGITVVERGHLRVHVTAADDRRSTIDVCFTSIAQAYGMRSIGILLSGSGSDGTLGLRAIASVGGVTMAQDASARFDAMPRNAVASGVVDRVLTAPQLAEEVAAQASYLRRYARGMAEQDLQSRIEEVLPLICTEVERITGHGLHQYKASTLVRRIQRRLQICRVADAEAYLGVLRERSDEASLLLREVLIGVTSFFRDPEAFEFLAQNVIPRLLHQRGRDDHLRIWVAGCATGEEAYSLAMLFREALADRPDGPVAQIFATDIDERALAFARAGSYPGRMAETISRERLERWFVRRGPRWQVVPELREMCLFAAHNLVSDPPFSRLDLISCRNVLIYLGAPLQQKLVSIFHYGLRPNGYVFLGPSENIGAHTELFRPVSPKHRISQRKPTPLRSVGLLPRRESGRPASTTVPSEPLDRPDLHMVAQRIVLDEFAPAYVLVDEQGQILVASARIERYLEIGEGPFRNNVITMVKPGLRSAVRPALAEAIQTRKKIVRAHLSGTTGDAPAIRVGITVQPMPRLGESDDLYMIVFQESEPTSDREAVREHAREATNDAVIEQLERELATTRDDLEHSIQDLEAANEELKSSNEELLSMNEELQSANEELETSKEEIQAGNEALARANTDLENLLASSEIATIFLDDEMRVQRFTPTARAIYNLLPVDVGRPIDHITHRAESMPRFPGPGTASSAMVLQDELTTVDGRTYLRRVLPYRTQDGQQRGIVATYTDVTALRNSEQRVRQHVAELEAIYASAPVGLAVFDTDLRYVRANHWLARLAGTSEEGHIGRRIDEVDGPLAAEMEHWVRRAFETGEPVSDVEMRSTSVDGTSTAVHQGSYAPLVDAAGNVVLVNVVIQDVTERARHIDLLQDSERRLLALAEELAQAKQIAEGASRAKSDFLANMSHEIRTPMTAILGYADVLETRLADPDDRACVGTIKRNGHYLVQIINDILDLSKIEAGKLVPELVRFDPLEVLGDVESLMGERARERGLHLMVQADGPLPATVRGDPTRLRQVLVNLISNAIKFTNEGSVTATVRCNAALEQLEFGVTDTGIGMAPELQARLFEPFSQADTSLTRRYGGTGLGLAISKRLVEALGGGISATSTPGRGSTFSFTVPTGSLEHVALVVGRRREPPRPVTPPLPQRSLVGARVLLVDDRRDVRHLMQSYLEDAGADVECAGDGQAALDEFERERADGGEPDVIVLDMQMPTLDGYQAAQRLRALGFTGPIVALTAAAMKGDREKCLAAGCNDYLTKPIDRASLVSCVSRHAEAVRAKRAAPQISPPPSDPSGHARVLIVDDHEDSVEALAMLLERIGYDVRTAVTGRDAVAAAQEFVPDAVLLDLGLPDIDGYAVLEAMRAMAHLARCTFIALSGRGLDEDVGRSREAGFHHHVVKPAGLQALQSVLPTPAKPSTPSGSQLQ